MTDPLGHYAALGLPPGAPADQVRAQFRLLAKHHHPDLHGGDPAHQETFLRIHDAYEFLADARRRADDNTLSTQGHAPSGAPAPLWVHVGSQHRPPVTGGTSPGKPRHRHHLTRAARGRLAAALTWALTLAALCLYGTALRTTHAGPIRRPATTKAAAARHPRTRPVLVVTSHDTGPITQAPIGTWTPPAFLTRPMAAPSNAGGLKAETPSPNEPAIDPAYITVDPRSTSIDPELTTP